LSLPLILGAITMDVLIESTRDFEQDLEQFSNTEKFKIIKKLNQYVELLSTDKNLFYQHSAQLRNIRLNENYDSSIYSLKINENMRIILTIDDDPIFERTLITLFRVVKAEDAPAAYNSVAETLYQDFTVNNQDIQVSFC
jgi:Txe/YoeB family toxin of Txe-Axe toxin-antitoxin module